VTRSGRYAAVTNFRDPARMRAEARSRGALAGSFMVSDQRPGDLVEKMRGRRADYNDFNFIAGDAHDQVFYGSREDIIQRPGPGLYALSNGQLDCTWPKAGRARQALHAALQKDAAPDAENLLALLRDTTLPPDAELPDTAVGLEMERLLAPVFIASGHYGTRSSTVLLHARDGAIRYIEQTYGPGGAALGRVDQLVRPAAAPHQPNRPSERKAS
jgi:uncharacterized protein with NRDE domain